MNEDLKVHLKVHLTHEAARARRARIAELIRGIDGAPGIPRAEAVKLVDIDPGPNPDPQPVGPPAGPRVIVVNEYGTPLYTEVLKPWPGVFEKPPERPDEPSQPGLAPENEGI